MEHRSEHWLSTNISPAANVFVEPLVPALGLQSRGLPASIVRASSGEIEVKWLELASTDVFALMTEAMLNTGGGEGDRPMAALGHVRFCELASATAV
jgi:hypothetical protein